MATSKQLDALRYAINKHVVTGQSQDLPPQERMEKAGKKYPNSYRQPNEVRIAASESKEVEDSLGVKVKKRDSQNMDFVLYVVDGEVMLRSDRGFGTRTIFTGNHGPVPESTNDRAKEDTLYGKLMKKGLDLTRELQEIVDAQDLDYGEGAILVEQAREQAQLLFRLVEYGLDRVDRGYEGINTEVGKEVVDMAKDARDKAKAEIDRLAKIVDPENTDPYRRWLQRW